MAVWLCKIIVFISSIVLISLLGHCSKGILESLRRRARIMTDGFNSCRNVICNFTEGMLLGTPRLIIVRFDEENE